MLKVRKFQKYVKEASYLEEIYIGRFLLKNSKHWGPNKMRIGEMSSSEFSEFVDTRLAPQLLAVLEEIKVTYSL